MIEIAFTNTFIEHLIYNISLSSLACLNINDDSWRRIDGRAWKRIQNARNKKMEILQNNS